MPRKIPLTPEQEAEKERERREKFTRDLPDSPEVAKARRQMRKAAVNVKKERAKAGLFKKLSTVSKHRDALLNKFGVHRKDS